MKLLNLTLETPAENLALDEALLEEAESTEGGEEVLRLWESPSDFAVLGRSSDLEQEVHVERCREERVPIFRRRSGGGVVTVGPGSLMYAVVLRLDRLPAARGEGLVSIDQAHEYVLSCVASTVSSLLPDETISRDGTSDLIIQLSAGQRKKFSGNSLRIRRRHFLYHGTLLYDYDLAKITRWLARPKHMPEYRQERSHADFVANLQVTRTELESSLISTWNAETPLSDWPRERTQQLASSYEAL
ncbi:MAG: lipoate--protein ligase family protein [Lacipirellulaceae bacterium]